MLRDNLFVKIGEWLKRSSAVLGSQSVAGVSPVEGTGVVSPMSDCFKKGKGERSF